MTHRPIVTGSALALLIAACSSGGSGASPAGSSGTLDPNEQVSTLSDVQRGQLCDYALSLYGASYGKNATLACDGGTGSVQPWGSQLDCLSDYATVLQGCTATVSQLEACFQSSATIVEQCGMCAFAGGQVSSPECQRLTTIGGCGGNWSDPLYSPVYGLQNAGCSHP